jgi:hypothetical protein
MVTLAEIGPGAPYNTVTALTQLRAIADFLNAQGIPFNISLIPRFIDPALSYDKSISQTADPFIQLFDSTISYMVSKGGLINVQGFTDQFGTTVTAGGFEFSSLACHISCPPNDPVEACVERPVFTNSYAYGRMNSAFTAVAAAGLTANSFASPDANISNSQRCVQEAWAGLFVEGDPANTSKRTVSIRDTQTPFYRGVVYVPTPLGSVSGANPQADVNRICQAISGFTGQDVASFLFQPFLDFPFITITASGVTYATNSYLHQIVTCMQNGGFVFKRPADLVNFVPSSRQTNFFPGTGFKFFPGDVNGDGKTDLIVWDQAAGNWHIAEMTLPGFPVRQTAAVGAYPALVGWGQGNVWKPLIGDYNGDGFDDIAVFNATTGSWQVSLSDRATFTPSLGRGDFNWLLPWAASSAFVAFSGDFNGDGIDDVMVWNPAFGTWQVALSTGSLFVPNPGANGNFIWLNNFAVGSFWNPVIGDFNGDGIDDIAVLNTHDGTWQVALGTGSQFVPNAGSNGNFLWATGLGAGGLWTPLTGDWNGDGKTDIGIFQAGNWQMAKSTGSLFVPVGQPFLPWGSESGVQPFVGDWNGNGKSDIMARNPALLGGTIDFAFSLIS